MALTRLQQEVLAGMIMGDAYVQPTGKSTARLRIEQSEKQKDYALWKCGVFAQLMQGKPILAVRFNPIFKKTYRTFRCQSFSTEEFGAYRKLFYNRLGRKIIPVTIGEMLSKRALAVWYMDDGYFYRKERSIAIYLSRYAAKEFQLLRGTLKEKFGIAATLYKKKRGWNFYLPVDETKKFLKLVQPYVLPSFRYKIL